MTSTRATRFSSRQYEAYPQLLELIEKEFSEAKPKKIVDVGGGDGEVARRAAAWSGGRVWCVDPQATSNRKKNAGAAAGVEFVRAKGEKLPFKNGFFDAALACFSLEYCDAPRTLREIRRIAKSRALFCALFHHPDSFWAEQFGKQRRTYAFALPFFKKAASSKIAPAELNAFERRIAALNALPFPPLAAAPLAALERFERFSERPQFAGDWLPELYASLAAMQKSFLLGKPRAAAKTAAAESRRIIAAREALPKRVFSPGEALRLVKKAGFTAARSRIVLDNRGKPLAFAVAARNEKPASK